MSAMKILQEIFASQPVSHFLPQEEKEKREQKKVKEKESLEWECFLFFDMLNRLFLFEETSLFFGVEREKRERRKRKRKDSEEKDGFCDVEMRMFGEDEIEDFNDEEEKQNQENGEIEIEEKREERNFASLSFLCQTCQLYLVTSPLLLLTTIPEAFLRSLSCEFEAKGKTKTALNIQKISSLSSSLSLLGNDNLKRELRHVLLLILENRGFIDGLFQKYSKHSTGGEREEREEGNGAFFLAFWVLFCHYDEKESKFRPEKSEKEKKGFLGRGVEERKKERRGWERKERERESMRKLLKIFERKKGVLLRAQRILLSERGGEEEEVIVLD